MQQALGSGARLQVALTLALLGLWIPAIAAPAEAAAVGVSTAADEDRMPPREKLARLVLRYKDIADEGARERLYLRAAEAFEKHLKTYPEDKASDQARFYLAECRWHLKETGRAVEGWTSVVGSGDVRLSSMAHVRLADYLYARGRYREAQEHFRTGGEKALDRDESIRCRLHVGICYYRLKEYESAKDVLKTLIKDVRTGIYATMAQQYLDRLEDLSDPQEESRGAKESIEKYLQDYGEYQKTGNTERKRELTESIRTNIQDWNTFDDPKIFSLLRKIVGTPRHPFASMAIQELIQIKTPEAIAELIAIVKEKGHTLRPSVLRSLASNRIPVERSIVISIFRDRSERVDTVRIAAADYIAMWDTEEAVEILFGEIMVPGDPKVKANTAVNEGIRKAIQRLKSAEAAKALREIVADSKRHPIHRRYALEAVGRIGGPETVDVLIPLMEERQLEIVSLAAEALGRTGDPRAAAPLLDLLRKKPKHMGLVASLLRGLDRLEVSPEAEDLFLSFAKSRDYSVRVLAHSLLRQTWGKRARKKLRDALSDKVWQVRWHAVRAMGQNPSPENIGALIDRLPKEEGRLKYEILKYLHRLAGEDLGLDPKVWKGWWKKARDGYDPAAIELATIAFGPAADKTVSAADVPEYFTLKVRSRNAVFVIDISGSMVGEITVPKSGESTGSGKEKKIKVAKRELIAVLRLFKKRTSFNIIWFETRYQPLWKLMKPATQSNVAEGIKAVRGLNAAGGTNIYDSLAFALSDPRVDTIYFLSDGAPSAGTYTNHEDILREIRSLNYARKVAIHTIFLGGTSTFMRRLAEENYGRYVPVSK